MIKQRFHKLGKLIAQSYKEEDMHTTEALSREYLELAEKYKENWNYGNAIHQSNIFLGLVALENKEKEKAKEHLLAAGNTPGSPQLNSFGPNMLLAKKIVGARGS